ncbi:TonB-dependent hemoglobin/transferrin/lactoferrin family receptor [Vibrio tarriae]|uniref:TonB-dependent hemoglobin/transferrin/lactoferrin family receptor n=1 Tax=Vibrio tarriae TaxID=2014742 RepID=UPI000DE22E42|nr:TonB-dependent hemoglobin/transferrin/lactoferrin family receptor [Vibrio tarriae]RBM31652.1 ligand-gated channel [Vibrio tarriae]
MKLSPVSAAVLSVLAAGFAHAETEPSHYEEVVVTANRIEQPLSEVAGSVAVLEGETLEKQGKTELYDALNQEPGVSVTGGAGRPQNITIRGMTGNRIAIVRDGIQSADGYGAADINDKYGRNTFSLSNVKQIQVVKGASSTLYGSGAIGGVVIIESKAPEDYLYHRDYYVDAALTYSGISNRYQGNHALAMRHGDGEALLTIDYWQGEETRNFNQDLYNREVDGYNLGFTHHYWLNDALRLKTHLEYFDDYAKRREGTSSIQKDDKWDLVSFYEYQRSQTRLASVGADYTANLSWMDTLEGKLYWRSTENITQTNRLMANDRSGAGILSYRRELRDEGFNDEALGATLNAQKEWQQGEWLHQFAYGMSVDGHDYQRPKSIRRMESSGDDLQADEPFAPAREYRFGVYGQDNLLLGDWTLAAGLRFDAQKLSPKNADRIHGYKVLTMGSSEWSPSASISYQWHPEWNTYLSYNHGFRAPSYDKAYGASDHSFVPLTPFIIKPNNKLRAETSDSFELGSKYDNGQTQLYVAVFYSIFDNFIDIKQIAYDDTTGSVIQQYQNIAGVKTYGAEMSLVHRLDDRWSVENKLGYVDGKDGENQYVRTLTPLEGSVQLNYQRDRWDAYSRLNWASAMSRVPTCTTEQGKETECATTTGWVSWDIGLNYQWNAQLSASFNVVNLLDREYTRYQDVAGVTPSDTRYSTEPGRYFTVHAKYVF